MKSGWYLVWPFFSFFHCQLSIYYFSKANYNNTFDIIRINKGQNVLIPISVINQSKAL